MSIRDLFATILNPNREYRRKKDNEAKIRAWAREQDNTHRMVVIFDRHKDALLQDRARLLRQGEPYDSDAWVYHLGQEDYEACMKMKVDRLLGFKLVP